MVNYICLVCGFIFKPEYQDLEKGIEPGTPFEELPEDWRCPLCGISKANFDPE